MQEATTHEVIYQSIIAFFVLFVLARILGKRQIAQLTFFDYVTGLTLGNIAGAWSLDQVKNLHAIIALSIWTLLTIALALIQIKFYKSRSILDGKPRELIQAGKLLEKNLKKARLSTEELLLMLRQKNAFKVADVEYAVFENNGKLSVLKKSDVLPLTPKDISIPVVAEGEPRVLIIDGNVMEKSLHYRGYSHEWLMGEVMKQGAGSIQDVFFAEVDSNGNLYVDLYYDSAKVPQIKKKPLLAATLKKLQADLEMFAIETQNQDAKQSYSDIAERLKGMMIDVMPYLKE